MEFINWNDDAGATRFSRLNTVLEPDRTYFIKVFGYDDLTVGPYLIDVADTGAMRPLAVDGGPVTGTISRDVQEEWFSFYAPSTGSYTIETRPLSAEAEGDTSIEIRGPDSPFYPIVSDDNAGEYEGFSKIIHPLEGNHTYYVKLIGERLDPEAPVDYAIDVTLESEIPEAVLLTVDGGGGAGELESAAEGDWYAFRTESAGSYTIQTHPIPGEGDTDTVVFLLGPDNPYRLVASMDQNEDDESDQSGFSRMSVTLEADRIYYVKVVGYDNVVGVGPYLIDVVQVEVSEMTPTPSRTPEPVITPTPTEVFLSVDFSAASVEEMGLLHGAATGLEPAPIRLDQVPGGVSQDQRGLVFDAAPGQGTLAILSTPVSVGEGLALISVFAGADGPDCSLALAALNSPIDGQLGYTISSGSDVPLGEWRRLLLLYDPPNDLLMPALQVSVPDSAAETVSVFYDNLTVSKLPRLSTAAVSLDVDGSFDGSTEGILRNVNGDSGSVQVLTDFGGKNIALSVAETDNAANIGVFASQLQGGFPHLLLSSVDAQLYSGSGGVTALVMTNGFGNVGVFVNNAGLSDTRTIQIGGGFVAENPGFPVLCVVQNGGQGATSSVIVDNLALTRILSDL